MRVLSCLFLVLLFLLSCSDDPVVERVTPPRAVQRPDVISLDGESEEAALWLSGQLTAPPELYETIHDDLTAIRAEYGDVIPVDYDGPLHFTPWWITSEVVVLVTTELKNKMVAHIPNPLDSLSAGMHAVSRGYFSGPWGSLGWQTSIHFAGRLHSQRLAEMYGTLPGVNVAFVDSPLGDFSNVYPWHIPGGMSYLFRYGWGDCPAGCEISDFYYFRRVGGATEFVGSFRTYFDPYPAWWAEANDAYCAFEVEHWGWPYCPWEASTDPGAKSVAPAVSSAP